MEQSINPDSLFSILIIVGACVVGFMFIGFTFAKLYTRATKEIAFVRTGLGGEKSLRMAVHWCCPWSTKSFQ